MKQTKTKVVNKTEDQKNLKFDSTNVQVELTTEQHPNAMYFTATFAHIGTPSDGTPCGADKPVVIDAEEANESIKTMNFMGIDCEWSEWWPEYCMTGHDTRNKIGVVRNAYIEGSELKIDGLIYSKDFSDIAFFIRNATPSLGFSMECLASSEVEDDGYEHLHDITFTGVAILFKNLAAYEDTYLDYVASKKKGTNELTKEEMEQLVGSLKETINASQADFEKRMDKKFEAFKASKVEPKTEDKEDELTKLKEELEAAKQAMAEQEQKAKEELEATKAKFEQEKADIEAQRKSNTGHKSLNASKEEVHEIWKDGFDKGLSKMFSKMKETMEEQ